MTRSNSQLFILVFLGILTAFGPFVTDMYLPTLPAMTDYFHTTSSQVQLGLTASMIGLAVGQLFFGPLSDKYGRRLPLIVAMCLFLLATLGCLYSRTIMQFVGWRVVQGIAGAGGIVISRSIAADKYSGRELAKMLAIIGAIKIEILMLKENNERGGRMMFLSLEQLQKLKLNPTRADYEIAYETEVKEQEGTAFSGYCSD